MHDVDVDPDARAAAWRRRKWLGVSSAAALLLHAVALSGLEWAWPASEVVVPPAASMLVRALEPAQPVVTPVPDPPVAVVVAPAQATARSRPTPAPMKPEVPASAARPSEAVAHVMPAVPELAAEPPAAVPGDEAIPIYPTRMPPALTLRYEVQRGLLRGTGDLSWRPQGDRYELRLDARVGALPVLNQVSTGGFDTAGVAPQRFTDQRLRRGTTAANFQRDAGKISFSGPATEYPLRDGAQDRLSWMVQLAAIVAAEPRLGRPGAKVVMFVAGSHGDAGVWVFRCIGPEPIVTDAGTVEAIKFVREPREAYDATVQVWLDPDQHHLPVRATQQSGPNDEPFELRLQQVIPAN